MGYLNINSIRNKSETLLISETKLDDSFPIAQFQMKGFSVPYSYDRNRKDSGLLLYNCEDIQSKLLINKSKCNIETLSVAACGQFKKKEMVSE